ncbi:ATP-dependent Clp protease adapter ClpS [Agromyces mediolanus]|uniref:ATP-dependent Clp protease adapter ClpS n=1 Tax=Agromyces mediolanus TaxID=41986 RepID=UPI00203AF068|nr:ATP-dependent Clp protease adapter ClpS [Agromyces mediolanus]MCM3657567.1 ATP-dependent Clp protease adapter ClpS [Agromyces mediolanus]
MTGILEATDVDLDVDLDRATREGVARSWRAIVWDDPVNLMSYVSYVFRSYFGYSREEAERLMLLVHTTGKAVVATGHREAMERHVQAMHGYGLQATVARAES